VRAVPVQQVEPVVPVQRAARVAQVLPVQRAVPAVMAQWHRMPAARAPQAVPQRVAQAAMVRP
jgi:hypothetical protein